MSVFRSARALSRHGPWTARSTFAPIEWSMIVPGAGVGRTKKPKVVRHPPTMWQGGTTISRGRAYRHRAVATCCSGTSFFLRHVIILVVSGPSKADRRETRATARLSMIIVRAQRVWRVTFDAQQDFSSHGASSSCAVEPPTSRVVRRRPTWPSASRVRPGSVWSGWARWDRQRTMYTRASPAAHPEPSKVEHFR